VGDPGVRQARDRVFDLALISDDTLPNHWRILREAGLTATVVDGRTHRMRLRAADLDDRFPGLLETLLRIVTGSSKRLVG
jgi:DNA-binding transcriptional ArsR family regulator